MNPTVTLLVLILATTGSEGAKVLLHPYGHCLNSHLYNMEKMAAILLKGGHDVTILIHENYTEAHADLNMDKVNFLHYTPPKNVPIICSLNSLNEYLTTPGKKVMDTFYDSTLMYCEAILQDKVLMHKLKKSKFDIGIYDVVDPCSRIIADHVGIPFITFHSHGIDTLLPRNPAYLPAIMTSFSDDMRWWQRALNTLGYIMIKIISYTTMRRIDALKARYNIKPGLSVADTYDRASLKFVLGDFALDYAGPMQPSTILVGGFIQQPSPRPISHNIQKFMDESENGTVLLNLGTLVRYYDEEWREMFAKALADLPYSVIWKYEGPTPKNLGKNTITTPWNEQFSILQHKKVKAFVTHAGFNSVYESAYNGVPAVAVPLFGEQSFQATKVVQAKMGVKLGIHDLTASKLTSAILEVAGTPKYKKNAKHISDIMRNKPQSQEDEILHWVNYVLKIGNTHHLRSKESKLYWYQVYLIDVALIYSIILAFIYVTSKKVLCLLVSPISFISKSRLSAELSVKSAENHEISKTISSKPKDRLFSRLLKTIFLHMSFK